jgi:hypothetical protein
MFITALLKVAARPGRIGRQCVTLTCVALRRAIDRIPLTLRALVLLPLLATGLDELRASIACSPGARSCLEAAGQGWMGSAGTAVLVLYSAGLALLVARLARDRESLWGLGIGAVWAACLGQAAIVSALGAGSLLGGGWLTLVVLGVLAGAALAFALTAVRRFARAFFVFAPRPRTITRPIAWSSPRPVAAPARLSLSRLAPRAPPLAA